EGEAPTLTLRHKGGGPVGPRERRFSAMRAFEMFRNDGHGDGEVAVVRDADVDFAARQRGAGGDPDVRTAIVARQNLDVTHPRPRNPARHRLADGLFGGPAAGPALSAIAA